MILTYTIARLKRMNRPAGYVDDMRACAIKATETDLTFDTDLECWKAIKAKYSAPVAPSQGLGDTVKSVIQAVTLGKVKPCAPCEKHRQTLNRLVPYK